MSILRSNASKYSDSSQNEIVRFLRKVWKSVEFNTITVEMPHENHTFNKCVGKATYNLNQIGQPIIYLTQVVFFKYIALNLHLIIINMPNVSDIEINHTIKKC